MIRRFLATICLGLFALVAGGKEDMFAPLYHISTDKPIYRPGETVYMRAVVLDGKTNTPLKDRAFPGEFKICDGRDNEVFRGPAMIEDSTMALGWQIPEGTAGGVYTIEVADVESNGASGIRTFEIRAYRPPRIKTQIDFLKRGYFPGEAVAAFMEFSRAEGGIPANAEISAVALLDGQVIAAGEKLAYSAETGRVDFSFELPGEISEGEGVISFTIRDGGVVETAAKTLPIMMNNYTVDFYPEGGDLIAGVENRVYVQVSLKNGKGADVVGSIARKDGDNPLDFKTIHDGRGFFAITPEAGAQYTLALPDGQGKGGMRTFALPEAKEGAVIHALQPAYSFNEKIALKVAASPKCSDKPGYVVLHRRSLEIAKADVPEDGQVALDAGDYEGVLVATLYSKGGKPLAERLVFRKPKFRLNLAMDVKSDALVPGGKVTVEVTATNDSGEPVEAVVGLAVTDESVLEMIDKREQAPRLPAMVYLENDVLDLKDAHVYLDESDESSAEKLDLLLGTQGWRRFVFVNQADIEKMYPEAYKRIIAKEFHPFRPRRMERVGAGGGIFFENAKALGAAPMAVNGAAVPEAAAMNMDDGLVLEEAEMEYGAAEADMGGVDAEYKFDQAIVPMPEPAEKPAVMMDVADAGEAGKQNEPAMDVEEPMLAKQVMPPPRPNFYFREYAHKVRQDRKPNDRVDFAETLYWNAAIRTNARTGKAEIEFDLSDAVTNFRVQADGFAANAAIGSADKTFSSVEPFYVEPKFPVTISVDDEVTLPVALVNSTDKELAGVNVAVSFNGRLCRVGKESAMPASLAAGERARIFANLDASGLVPGDYPIEIKGIAGGYSDSVKRVVHVVSKNYPVNQNKGGRVSADKPLAFEIVVPDSVENGTQEGAFQIYSSPAASLEAALNALLRQPHGCFEQTSSTNYPLVMAQQYFLSHSGVDPQKITQAAALLEEGLKRLTSYECKNKGYEWFGEDPGHEALTAYGLMEFSDMAKVMPLDDAIVRDASAWLAKRRDGNGGYLRNEAALDSFGRAEPDVTNLYITWALLESGENPANFEKEIAAAKEAASTTKNMYVKALGANIMALAGNLDAAARFSRELATAQKSDGSLDGVTDSITCSRGDSLVIEGTSLAILAWLRSGDEFVAPIEAGMKFLSELCKNGKFGSTQSTVLALKAINAYDKQFAKPLKAGSLQLFIDGEPFGRPQTFDEKTSGIISMPDFGLKMLPGRHSVELRMTDGSELSASASFSAMCSQPDSKGKLALAISVNETEAEEGKPLQMTVALTNGDAEDANMPVIVVAVPGGLKARMERLQELVAEKRIAAYETKDNLLVIYLRGLHAGDTASIPLSLVAEVPGTYTGAASYAYLYYLDEQKVYVPGVTAVVK